MAGEVLTERGARLVADPLSTTVPGAVSPDRSTNPAGLERQRTARDGGEPLYRALGFVCPCSMSC
ncbi:hypothetical protein [Streptomyces sp. NPDC057582]|uniref:hypothetical protein n=1 Tax=Streptomyces sp. NPDC057582 TaxID=3346174 RepID=UPI00368BB538